MNFKLSRNTKIIAGITLSSALTICSLGTIFVFASDNKDAVQKNVLISAPALPASSGSQKELNNTQGSIQYSKTTYKRSDGSQNFVFENWYNPDTKEERHDYKEYSTDNTLQRYHSNYYVNNGNDLITIERDQNGKAISGTDLKKESQPTFFRKFEMNNSGFDSIKKSYTNNLWAFVGTEQTPDGKTLNKISHSYQSYIDDNTQANMQLFTYIDEATGLPVKDELYEDSTGQIKLFSSNICEYNYTTDDGTLFNTDEIVLTEVQGPAETFGK